VVGTLGYVLIYLKIEKDYLGISNEDNKWKNICTHISVVGTTLRCVCWRKQNIRKVLCNISHDGVNTISPTTCSQLRVLGLTVLSYIYPSPHTTLLIWHRPKPSISRRLRGEYFGFGFSSCVCFSMSFLMESGSWHRCRCRLSLSMCAARKFVYVSVCHWLWVVMNSLVSLIVAEVVDTGLRSSLAFTSRRSVVHYWCVGLCCHILYYSVLNSTVAIKAGWCRGA